MKKVIASLITVISFLLIVTVGDSLSEPAKKSGSDKAKKSEYEQFLEKCNKSGEDDKAKKESLESCKKAIKLKPNDPVAYIYTGRIYFGMGIDRRTGDLDKKSSDMAIEFITKAIELKPTDIKFYLLAYNQRGYIYLQREEYDKAVVDFNEVLKIEPNNAYAKENLEIAQKFIDVREKLKTLTENLKEKPDVYDNYYELAKVYADINEYKKVVENMDKYIEEVKDNYKAFRFRGWAKGKLEDKNGAYEDYTKAIELEPNDADNYYWRSFTYDTEEGDKKVADLRKAIELKPDYDDALWRLGWELNAPIKLPTNDGKYRYGYSNDRLYEAIDTFTKLSKVNPNYDARVYRFLAVLYMELKPPDCENAIANRKKAVEMSHDDQELKYLAETYIGCKKYEDAINTYREILNMNKFTLGSKSEYIVELAKIYMIKNGIKLNDINEPSTSSSISEFIEATNYLQEGIKSITPQCKSKRYKDLADKKVKEKEQFEEVKLFNACRITQEIFGYLGLIYEKLGKTENAIESFTKAIEIFPDFVGSLGTHRAALYYDNGDYEQALKDCEYSIEHKNNPFSKFGNIYCTESFVEKIKKKIETEKIQKERYAKYKRYIDLYKSTLPPEMKHCSWNVRTVNEVTRLSISETLYIVYQEGLGITEVKLPGSISQELSAMARQRGLKISMDIDLPFYVWFADNVMGESLDQSASGLCYFSSLIRKSQFDVIQTFINGYLDSLKKKA